MELPSKTFCILPWLHLYKHTDDSIKLCCTDKGDSLGSLKSQSVDEIRNSEEFTKIRESFLKGEKLDRCKECWAHEKSGYESYRQSSNFSYRDLIKETEEFKPAETLNIKYLDYRPSNLCNLACKICSPRFSTKLIDPWIKANQLSEEEGSKLTKLNNSRVSLDTVKDNLDNLDSVYFAGGEPMITQGHWDLLDMISIKNPESIRLKYNTNLTKLSFNGYNIGEYWPKFKKVMIGASLDGYGTQFEHMRTGGKWNIIIENLNTLKQLSIDTDQKIIKKYGKSREDMGIELFCDSTIGWLNLKSVFKLHKFLVEHEYIKLDSKYLTKLGVKPLNYPFGASLDNTPLELREELIKEVEDYKTWFENVYPYGKESWESNVNSLIKKIKNSKYEEKELKQWLKLTKILDKKYKLYTPEAFKFNNEDWNKKFELMYNKIELI